MKYFINSTHIIYFHDNGINETVVRPIATLPQGHNIFPMNEALGLLVFSIIFSIIVVYIIKSHP